MTIDPSAVACGGRHQSCRRLRLARRHDDRCRGESGQHLDLSGSRLGPGLRRRRINLDFRRDAERRGSRPLLDGRRRWRGRRIGRRHRGLHAGQRWNRQQRIRLVSRCYSHLQMRHPRRRPGRSVWIPRTPGRRLAAFRRPARSECDWWRVFEPGFRLAGRRGHGRNPTPRRSDRRRRILRGERRCPGRFRRDARRHVFRELSRRHGCGLARRAEFRRAGRRRGCRNPHGQQIA